MGVFLLNLNGFCWSCQILFFVLNWLQFNKLSPFLLKSNNHCLGDYRRGKSWSMTHYELTYIVSIKFLDDEMNKVTEKIEKIIVDLGGKITSKEVLGKQKLAYPLKQIHQGTYASIEFDLEGEKLKELDTDLKLMNELLRHLVIKKRVRTEAEIEREKQVQERLRKEKELELNKLEESNQGGAKQVESSVVEEVKAEQTAEAKKEDKDSKKVSLEDLDKKLDEILTDDII